MSHHLLIAEDDRQLQRLFAKALRAAGYRVDTTHKGQDVLHCLLDEVYDLLILDLSLSDMQGIEVLRAIQSRGLKRQTRIIIITGNHLADEEPEAQLAELFLLKPVDIKELTRMVERLLAHSDASMRV